MFGCCAGGVYCTGVSAIGRLGNRSGVARFASTCAAPASWAIDWGSDTIPSELGRGWDCLSAWILLLSSRMLRMSVSILCCCSWRRTSPGCNAVELVVLELHRLAFWATASAPEVIFVLLCRISRPICCVEGIKGSGVLGRSQNICPTKTTTTKTLIF